MSESEPRPRKFREESIIEAEERAQERKEAEAFEREIQGLPAPELEVVEEPSAQGEPAHEQVHIDKSRPSVYTVEPGYSGGVRVCAEREATRIPVVGVPTQIELELTSKQKEKRDKAQQELAEGAERTPRRLEAARLEGKDFTRKQPYAAGEHERIIVRKCEEFPPRTLECIEQERQRQESGSDCDLVKYTFQCVDATLNRMRLTPGMAAGVTNMPKTIGEQCVLGELQPKGVVENTRDKFVGDELYRTIERLAPPKKQT